MRSFFFNLSFDHNTMILLSCSFLTYCDHVSILLTWFAWCHDVDLVSLGQEACVEAVLALLVGEETVSAAHPAHRSELQTQSTCYRRVMRLMSYEGPSCAEKPHEGEVLCCTEKPHTGGNLCCAEKPHEGGFLLRREAPRRGGSLLRRETPRSDSNPNPQFGQSMFSAGNDELMSRRIWLVHEKKWIADRRSKK